MRDSEPDLSSLAAPSSRPPAHRMQNPPDSAFCVLGRLGGHLGPPAHRMQIPAEKPGFLEDKLGFCTGKARSSSGRARASPDKSQDSEENYDFVGGEARFLG